jgi:hypothetical protein
MGGHHYRGPPIDEVIQYPYANGRALPSVGPYAQFVEEDKGELVRFLQDMNQGEDMSGKCAQILPDILFVPDIGKDGMI